MKAMVVDKIARVSKAPLRLLDVPELEPQAGEVRVTVRCCGVCRTDLHVIEGDLPTHRLPLVVGHQVVGIVDKLGPRCQLLKVGQRVGIPWLRKTCGQCGVLPSRQRESVRVLGLHGLRRGRRLRRVGHCARGLCLRNSRRVR